MVAITESVNPEILLVLRKGHRSKMSLREQFVRLPLELRENIAGHLWTCHANFCCCTGSRKHVFTGVGRFYDCVGCFATVSELLTDEMWTEIKKKSAWDTTRWCFLYEDVEVRGWNPDVKETANTPWRGEVPWEMTMFELEPKETFINLKLCEDRGDGLHHEWPCWDDEVDSPASKIQGLFRSFVVQRKLLKKLDKQLSKFDQCDELFSDDSEDDEMMEECCDF